MVLFNFPWCLYDSMYILELALSSIILLTCILVDSIVTLYIWAVLMVALVVVVMVAVTTGYNRYKARTGNYSTTCMYVCTVYRLMVGTSDAIMSHSSAPPGAVYDAIVNSRTAGDHVTCSNDVSY